MSKDAARAAWLSDDVDLDYHSRQFDRPYRSTIAFVGWLETIGVLNSARESAVLDVGCGQGANVYYLSARHPLSRFTGVDINEKLVHAGNLTLQARCAANATLETGDLYHLDPKFTKGIDIALSFQTLSWLPEFREPLTALAALDPKWICLSSLFYDGPVSCTIQVEEHIDQYSRQKHSFYNIYSLPLVQQHLHHLGYEIFHAAPFVIDIDLPKNSDGRLGTYSQMLASGERLQISGPLLMPWHFIAAGKSR